MSGVNNCTCSYNRPLYSPCDSTGKNYWLQILRLIDIFVVIFALIFTKSFFYYFFNLKTDPLLVPWGKKCKGKFPMSLFHNDVRPPWGRMGRREKAKEFEQLYRASRVVSAERNFIIFLVGSQEQRISSPLNVCSCEKTIASFGEAAPPGRAVSFNGFRFHPSLLVICCYLHLDGFVMVPLYICFGVFLLYVYSQNQYFPHFEFIIFRS